MITITSAEFIKSAVSIRDSVPIDLSEVAFLGRSNVGKSSLINSVCMKKALAKSSATPGKTRLINFFEVEFKNEDTRHRARFVDLPGFGYAKVSKSELDKWQQSLAEFISNRTSITLFLHLIDSRHPELEIDVLTREFVNNFRRKDFEVFDVFTKIDKLNARELGAVKSKYPNGFFVSSTSKKGIDNLRDAIFDRVFGGKQ